MRTNSVYGIALISLFVRIVLTVFLGKQKPGAGPKPAPGIVIPEDPEKTEIYTVSAQLHSSFAIWASAALLSSFRADLMVTEVSR